MELLKRKSKYCLVIFSFSSLKHNLKANNLFLNFLEGEMVLCKYEGNGEM